MVSNDPGLWPIWTPYGHGWLDLRSGPLDFAIYKYISFGPPGFRDF